MKKILLLIIMSAIFSFGCSSEGTGDPEMVILDLSIVGEGTVMVNPQQTGYEVGESVELITEAAAGYSFSNWEGRDGGEVSSNTIVMDGNKEITAIFYDINRTYTIDFSVEGDGTISLEPQKDEYDYGEIVNINIDCADEYHILEWQGLNGSEVFENSIKIDSSKEIKALFGRIEDLDILKEKIDTLAAEDKQRVADINIDRIIDEKSYPIIDGEYISLLYQGSDDEVSISVDSSVPWTIWGYRNKIAMKKVEGTDLSYRKLKLPYGTKLDYRFRFSNNRTALDSLNPNEHRDSMRVDSEIRMPEAKEIIARDRNRSVEHGELNNHNLTVRYKNSNGSILVGTRRVQVYTPYNYDENKKYKVLYIKDGTWFVDSSDFVNQLDYMIENGEMEDVVAVFIDFIERDAEYIQSNTREYYYEYFIDDLIPWVENEYSVSSDREDRFLIGASNSGFAVTEIARLYSDKIKNVLAFSPAYYNYYLGSSLGFSMDTIDMPIKIYITGGEFEGIGSWSKTMYEYLRINDSVEGLNLAMYNYQHSQNFYGDVFEEGIKWLMSDSVESTRVKVDKCKINVQLYWEKTGISEGMEDKKAYFAFFKDSEGLLNAKSYDNRPVSDYYKEAVYIQELEAGKTEEIEFDLEYSETNWGLWTVFYDKNGDGKIETEKMNWNLEQDNGDDYIWSSDTKAISAEDSQIYIHLGPEY